MAGYPIVTFQCPLYNKDLWAHAVNRLHDGRIVDVEGVWEEKEWHLRWCDLMGLDPLEVYTRTWEPEAWENELLTGKFKLEYPYISGNAPLHAQTIMEKLMELSS